MTTTPWRVISLASGRHWNVATRQGAMNSVDRPYLTGNFMIVRAGTGEKWQRRNGHWIKLDPGRRPRKEKSDAA